MRCSLPWCVLVIVLLASSAFALEPKVGDPDTARTNLLRMGKQVPADLNDLVGAGEDLFFNETFHGNGRTCGTCHPASNNLTIDPQFVSQLPAGDPLFIAENDPNLTLLERPTELRNHTLIVEDTVDQFLGGRTPNRSVPHMFGLALTINSNRTDAPLDNTGWSGDGSPGDGTLRSFPTGAVVQHFPKTLARVPGQDFRLPTEDELEKMFLFLISLGPTELPDLHGMRFRDEKVEEGRHEFLGPGKCNQCHQNGGADIALEGFEDNLINTGVEESEKAPPGLPRDGGFGLDPDGQGGLGDGRFAPPPLIFAADTAPFFHNSSADTLKRAIQFYDSDAFKDSPGNLLLKSLDPNGNGVEVEEDALLAILTVLNAQENIRSAIAYQQRALTHPDPNALLSLSLFDLRDAINVLNLEKLHADSVAQLENARSLIEQAIAVGDLSLVSSAVSAAETARRLTFYLGADFDLNENVDGADLGLWEAGFGLTINADANDGDVDADKDVDGADFLFWQRQFGQTQGSAPPVAQRAIPEPSTLALLLGGALLAFAFHPPGRAASVRGPPPDA